MILHAFVAVITCVIFIQLYFPVLKSFLGLVASMCRGEGVPTRVPYKARSLLCVKLFNAFTFLEASGELLLFGNECPLGQFGGLILCG